MEPSEEVMLEIRDLEAGYDFLQILWGISLRVSRGEFVALVGLNGAGKSTTLRAVAGLVATRAGTIRFQGRRISGLPADRISQTGMSFVSESLNLFTAMTVYENLLLGAYVIRDKREQMATLDHVFDLFPRLKARQKQLAGTLSGGERKMLAIGRGLMSRPSLLLVDEPSLGLAPKLAVDVFNALKSLQQQGMTILLVEQNVNTTLHITDRTYVLEQGRIVLEGRSQELLQNEYVQQVFLGIMEGSVN